MKWLSGKWSRIGFNMTLTCKTTRQHFFKSEREIHTMMRNLCWSWILWILSRNKVESKWRQHTDFLQASTDWRQFSWFISFTLRLNLVLHEVYPCIVACSVCRWNLRSLQWSDRLQRTAAHCSSFPELTLSAVSQSAHHLTVLEWQRIHNHCVAVL